MHTLVDFLTRVKGIEYLISLLTITGFILYVEVLKPRPFGTLVRSAREDLDYLRETGYRSTLRTVGRIAAAPFIGLAYVVILPFLFVATLAVELLGRGAEGFDRVLGMAGKSVSFGWRPMEAYLGGRKDKKSSKEEPEAEKKDREEQAP